MLWEQGANSDYINILILIELFGGLLVGLLLAILLYYHAPPVKRFWSFIIPGFIGFTCAGIMMVYYVRSRK
jgi:hypothetical protein